MDFITALVSEDLLQSNPGAACFYDLRSSKVAEETIAAAGGKPMMSRVGHSFIKAQMRENDAIFAGELSGHYYFKANFTAESSSMATFALANIVSKSGKPLSELIAPLRRYSQSGEINSRVAGDPAPGAREGHVCAHGGARVRARRRERGQLVPRRLVVQRAHVQHRAARAPQPRGEDARPHVRETRRAPRPHPRVRVGRSPCASC